MSDYTPMSASYDLIMTSGYYDYDAIVEHLAQFEQANTVLEIGSGTGLILERLAQRCPQLRLTGVDLTQAMLDIAAERLGHLSQITMDRQNVVTLCLNSRYDLAFSYGGVWYFSRGEADGDFTMVSHIRDEQENQQGFERLATHLPTGATLLLGVQSAHVDYATPVANGMRYGQQIVPIDNGFRKHYSLTSGATAVMEQTIDYRTYPFAEAVQSLEKCGFDYRPAREPATCLFLEFTKR